jgi:hypothetical protein
MVGVVPTAAPVKRPRGRPPKRKRESSGEEFEVRPPPAKKSKKGAAAAKTSTGKTKDISSEPISRKDKDMKDVKPPAPSRKKSKAEKPKSLFTTTPAPPLSEMVAKEAAAGEAGTKKEKGKGKARVKKEAEAEGEIKIKKEGDEEEGITEEKEVERGSEGARGTTTSETAVHVPASLLQGVTGAWRESAVSGHHQVVGEGVSIFRASDEGREGRVGGTRNLILVDFLTNSIPELDSTYIIIASRLRQDRPSTGGERQRLLLVV